MNDLHTSLTNAYNTQHAVMLPGSGTYAMEAAARAFGHEGDVVVVRNGYFSYRWSQLFECMGKSDDQVHVMKARPVNGWSDEEDRGVQPPPIEEVVAKKGAARRPYTGPTADIFRSVVGPQQKKYYFSA